MKKEEVQKEFKCSGSLLGDLVRDKILTPYRADEAGRPYIYNRKEILKALGIKVPVNEPFITEVEVAKILNFKNKMCVTPFVKKAGIPHYSFRKGLKGTRYLYLRSDFDAYHKIKTECDYGVLMDKYDILSKLCALVNRTSIGVVLTSEEKNNLDLVFGNTKVVFKYKNVNINARLLHSALLKITSAINRLDESTVPAHVERIKNLEARNAELERMLLQAEAQIKNAKKLDETLAKSYADVNFGNTVAGHTANGYVIGIRNRVTLEKSNMSTRLVALMKQWGTVELADVALLKRSWVMKNRNCGGLMLAYISTLLAAHGLRFADEVIAAYRHKQGDVADPKNK